MSESEKFPVTQCKDCGSMFSSNGQIRCALCNRRVHSTDMSLKEASKRGEVTQTTRVNNIDDDEEVKTLTKEDVKNAMSQLGVPFAGFAEVKNWDSLVDQHLAGGAQSSLVREWVNQCCQCKATTIDDRMSIRGCPNCQHMWCPTCSLVGKDNMEQIVPAKEALPLNNKGLQPLLSASDIKTLQEKYYQPILDDNPGLVERVTAMNEKKAEMDAAAEKWPEKYMQPVIEDIPGLSARVTEKVKQWVKEHTIPNWPYKQPFPVFNLGPDRETRYQTYHRGFKDGYDAAVRQYEGKEHKPTEE